MTWAVFTGAVAGVAALVGALGGWYLAWYAQRAAAAIPKALPATLEGFSELGSAYLDEIVAPQFHYVLLTVDNPTGLIRTTSSMEKMSDIHEFMKDWIKDRQVS